VDEQYRSCDAVEQEWSDDDDGEENAASDCTSIELQSASTDQPAVMLRQPADQPGAPAAGALTAEVQRRGLVRRDIAFSSRHKGVGWHMVKTKWRAEVYHGGKKEHLGYFATEHKAKACRDARCLDLGLDPDDPDAGQSSVFRGVSWDKKSSKWRPSITIDGKQKHLGTFEASVPGEVDAALAFDAAARAVGRPAKANFELQSANAPDDGSPEDTAARLHGPLPAVGEKCSLEQTADKQHRSCDAVEQEWSDDDGGEEDAASAGTSIELESAIAKTSAESLRQQQTRSIADIARPSKRALSSRVASKSAKTSTATESANNEKSTLIEHGYLPFHADWAAKATPRIGQQIAMQFEKKWYPGSIVGVDISETHLSPIKLLALHFEDDTWQQAVPSGCKLQIDSAAALVVQVTDPELMFYVAPEHHPAPAKACSSAVANDIFTHEIADCEPDHVGAWDGNYDPCSVLADHGDTVDVRHEDGSVCKYVPRRFLRNILTATDPDAPAGGALTAEVQRRGLVQRVNSFTSRQKGVSWEKQSKKWRAKLNHGGKEEYLGRFVTEEGAKARYDARCLELGMDQDAVNSGSVFRGVSWKTAEHKWKASIMIDGKRTALGTFEATSSGEVDAALAYDAAARVAGRPEAANFEIDSANAPYDELVEDTAPSPRGPLPAVGEKRALEQTADSLAADGRGEIGPLASATSAGTAAASPRSPPSKKPRGKIVAVAAEPQALTAADVVDHWLAGARLPSALRCAHIT
jgi:hypothetical protein